MALVLRPFRSHKPRVQEHHATIEWSLGESCSFADVDLIGYAIETDSDSDGLSDTDETRDLAPETPGVQNPFDPFEADSTGDDRGDTPDSIRDGFNDWDGDGLSNSTEFHFGLNPIDFESCGQVPSSSRPVLLLAACLLACFGIRKTREIAR